MNNGKEFIGCFAYRLVSFKTFFVICRDQDNGGRVPSKNELYDL